MEEFAPEQLREQMELNFFAATELTRLVLPRMRKQGSGHVLNLTSIGGLVSPGGFGAYCAAKFAVRGFSESLRHELRMTDSPVRLLVVHPGGIASNIARNSRSGAGVTDNARRVQSIERFEQLSKTTPQAAALRIIAGIEKNQPRILIGNDARFMDLLQRLRPTTYWAPIARRIEKMTKAGK